MPLCCYQDLSDALLFTVSEFDSAGLGYELDAGSNTGAVKIGGTLPWERDKDLNFRVQNFSATLKMTKKFEEVGYKWVNNE